MYLFHGIWHGVFCIYGDTNILFGKQTIVYPYKCCILDDKYSLYYNYDP